MTPAKFEAYTDCPKCGRIDHHWLREPKPAPTAAEMQAWQDSRSSVGVSAWGEYHIKTIDVSPPPPVDESQFEVIRICTGCGKEWGET